MRIDGTFGPEFTNLPKGKAGGEKSKASTDRTAPAEGLEVISEHKALVQQALATDEVNTQAVEDARQMLESGALDTPEAARRAAQNILDLGL